MDANVVTQIIATVGFPIAACVALGFFIKYVIEKFLAAVSDMNAKIMMLNEKHEEETKAMREVIQANTMSIKEMSAALSQYLQRGVDDGK